MMIEKNKEPTIATGAKKSVRTRETILLSAAILFRDRGYVATTLRDIAAAAKMKAGSIYYHFGSKIEILDEVLDCGLRDIHDNVQKALEDLGEETDYRTRITVAVQAHLSSLLLHSEFTSANIRNYGQLSKEIRSRHQPLRSAYAKFWDDLFEKAQKAGTLRADVKIKPLRQFVLGALNWTVEWFDSNNYSVSVLADRIAKIILDGFLVGSQAGEPTTSVLSRPVKIEVNSSQKKSGRTRQKILKTAASLFQKQGYASTTLRDIATAAQMQAGSIYYHFDTKYEILDAVLDRGLRDIHDNVEKIIKVHKINSDYRSKFTAAVQEHLNQLLVCSEFSSANLRIFGQLPQDLRKRHQPLRHSYSMLWDDLLREAKTAGILRQDVDIGPLRQFILGALNWTVEWFDAEKFSVDMLAERCAILLLDGITIESK